MSIKSGVTIVFTYENMLHLMTTLFFLKLRKKITNNFRNLFDTAFGLRVPITRVVPQGSIIGPLLFLVYINDLPNCLEKASPRMYADDTSISLAAANVSDLENKINRELINLNRWLKANKLSLNIAKTEFMIIGSRQRIQTNCCNHQFNIQLESKNIENVDR